MDRTAMPHRRQVHIVDDHASVRDSLSVLLLTARIESRVFSSAEEYLALASPADSACVILDNQLPGISGLELLKRLAEAANDTPVIMITGHGDVPTAVAAMRAGAFHFVEKPFDAEALLTMVETAMARTDRVLDRQSETQEVRNRRASLTQREREVLDLLIEGLPTKLIADRLAISPRTAEHHRAAVMQKMLARSISHLVRMALTLAPIGGAAELK
jgi:two-component system response regulator FixJ